MQVELTTEELSIVCKALDYMNNVESELICARLTEELYDAQELESIDLNDCGDSCKL